MHRFIIGLLMSLLICTSACADATHNQNTVASEHVNYNEPSRILTKAFKNIGLQEMLKFHHSPSRNPDMVSLDLVMQS